MGKTAITVVGVGALGSHFVQFLRSEDVRIKVIDFDRVEQKNVASQFHGKPSVGKLKVHSLQQGMKFFFSTKIDVVPHKLTSDNVSELLRGELIVDCLDNAEARTLVQEHVRASGQACLHGALAPGGEFGRVVWDDRFSIDSEAGMGEETCENGEFLPMIAITAAYLARATQLFIHDNKQVGFEITPTSVFST